MGLGEGGKFATLSSGALTFLAVVIGWVFFRADNFSSALTMLHGMSGMNGVSLPARLEDKLFKYFGQMDWIIFNGLTPLAKLNDVTCYLSLIVGFAIVWGLPNVSEIFCRYHPTCEDLSKVENSSNMHIQGSFGIALVWKQNIAWLLGMATLAGMVLSMMGRQSEFLYFKF